MMTLKLQGIRQRLMLARTLKFGLPWLQGLVCLGRDTVLFIVFCAALGLVAGFTGKTVQQFMNGQYPSLRGTLLMILILSLASLLLYFVFPKKLFRRGDHHAWLTRLCQIADRAEARWLGTDSEWPEQTLQKLDHHLGGWRGLLTLVTLLVLSAGLASLLSTNLASRSFWALSFGIFLAFCTLGLSLINTWFGYRKYQGRLRRWVLIMAVSCVPLIIVLSPNFQQGWRIAEQGSAQVPVSANLSRLLIFGVLLLSVLLIPVLATWRNRQHDEEINKLKSEAEHERLERQLSDSRLKLLQAQIEPHFLFNTLGAVQQAAEGKAPEAALLTSNLIRFLRGSLGQLRAETVSLHDEQRFITAYLEIMQARMGKRLSYRMQIEPELLHTSIPPTMLITLVENAIKHGLEPKPAGGEILVRAERQENQLLLTVADTGCGISDVGGGGVGLENIRERLLLSYANAASLELEMNDPEGFIARIRLPMHNHTKTKSEEETV